MNEAVATILGIGFWVLCALALVTLMSFVYVEIQYYKWGKEDREKQERQNAVANLSKEIANKIEEQKNKIEGNSK